MKLWKAFKIIFFNFGENSEHSILGKDILRTVEGNSSKIYAGCYNNFFYYDIRINFFFFIFK